MRYFTFTVHPPKMEIAWRVDDNGNVEVYDELFERQWALLLRTTLADLEKSVDNFDNFIEIDYDPFGSGKFMLKESDCPGNDY